MATASRRVSEVFVDERQELLQAWLEGEGERQGRPLPFLSVETDPSPRAVIHFLVCLLGGVLAAGIFACWLGTSWVQANRVSSVNQLRLEGMRLLVSDPNRSAWWKQEPKAIRETGSEFVLLLSFRSGALLLATVFGGMLLRAGCVLYNFLMGEPSPNRVPDLPLGKAMFIALMATPVNVVLGVGILPALAIFLLLASLVSALLPTTFARGVLVTLCYLLVTTGLCLFLAVIIGGSPGAVPVQG